MKDKEAKEDNKQGKMTNTYYTSYTENIYNVLEEYGILTFILPFLLIFSIIFLLLEITNLFKRDQNDILGRRVHILLSMGFAITALGNKDVIFWMSALIPQATIWLLAIFLFILVLGITFRGEIEIPRWLRGAISLIIVSAILVIAANALASRSGLSTGPIDYAILGSIISIVVVLTIIIAIITWVTSSNVPEAQNQNNPPQN